MKTNTTKKSPKVIVNLVDAVTPDEIYDAYIKAKVEAGVPITKTEFECEKHIVANAVLDEIDNSIEYLNVHYINDDKLAQKLLKDIKKYTQKKQPWYKRFWRWITFRK